MQIDDKLSAPPPMKSPADTFATEMGPAQTEAIANTYLSMATDHVEEALGTKLNGAYMDLELSVFMADTVRQVIAHEQHVLHEAARCRRFQFECL